MTSRDRAAEIYRFWFGEPDDPGYDKGRELWFKGGLELDETLRLNFLADHERSFASNAKALGFARHALAAGYTGDLASVKKCFFYLPFEHSEALEDQGRCVALLEFLPPQMFRDSWIDDAVKYHDMITRFGRFPYRNEILGRASTEEECAFLAETGTHFGTNPNRHEDC